MHKPLLSLRNLNVTFEGPRGPVHAIRDVSWSMGAEKVGIVGESGSGKTISSRAILGLLPASAQVAADQMEFDGVDLRTLTGSQWREVRGRRISMVMQDPRYSLNPVMTVGAQIMEAYQTHHRASRQEARARSFEMLEAVRIKDPERVFGAYPHEISGGMGQRVMIAMMLIPEPRLLIADEPTSALDVTVQNKILEVIDDMVSRHRMGLIFISHDLDLVSTFCDRILIMYRGRIVEECRADRLHAAEHPYTRGLLACAPRLGERRERLAVLDRQEAWER
ncbi:ABC transporter ATP-binding protein [uncultured Castellaniella sp.]|uniref:ABC transporter ATP-binding protein n=1 Tax=uncultured Castellaniella sp. TaxID=647907 RepID=UPI00261FE436|nr:ABC transporter ATP-binding protein [uncultured Castellaniella sp.]